MRRRLLHGAMILVLTVLYFSPEARAAGEAGRTMFQIFILGGGFIGAVLLLMNVVSVGFIIESFITVRRANILPLEVRERIAELLEQKQYREVIEFTEADPSVLSYVVHAGLSEAAHGYAAMQRAMEEASEERTNKLLRKIEVLNVVGNLGPMMGLLGTVYGMINSFNDIVKEGGMPKPAAMANNIGIALITTFWGLVVAIPALAAFGWMRTRIDGLSAETALSAQELLSTFRPGAEKPQLAAAE